MTISPPNPAAKKKTKSTKSTKSTSTSLTPSEQKTSSFPDVLPADTFAQATNLQNELNLMEEHQVKLQTQQALHQANIDTIRAQLQLQLFTIWNELWLQRQKVFAKAHEEWLKVFTA